MLTQTQTIYNRQEELRGHPNQQPPSVPLSMNQVMPEEKVQPHASLSCAHTAVYHQSNQCSLLDGVFHGCPVNFLPEGTQNLPPMSITSPQYFREFLSCMQQHCCVITLPGEYSHGVSISFLPTGTQSLPSAAMTSTKVPQPAPGAHEYSEDGPKMEATAGDLTACQLPNPSSSLPQGVAGASAHSSHKPLEEALQKRELRLMKNREAARECRRKKKEYVKCLENRVAVLENQNKTLIEELRALKDIYRHKVEKASREYRRKMKEYTECLETRYASLKKENQMLKAKVQRLKNP